MEPSHRQRSHEFGSTVGRDDAKTIGLAVVGGELGDEFAIGNAGRGGEAGLIADAPADVLGDRARGAEPAPVLGDVEIGFVEAERLDEVGVVEKDRADLLRYRAVDVEPRLDENQVRAAAPGRDRRHGRTDAVFAGLIACRHDDAAVPAADRHGPALERGIVALLHGRVEGVHVDMDDLARRADAGRVHRHVLPPHFGRCIAGMILSPTICCGQRSQTPPCP